MRTLILMRHAKSDWKVEGATDHERPLNTRGRRDAPKMGALINSTGCSPERVLCSDSSRTRQTWDGMSPELHTVEPTFLRALYLGGLDDIRKSVDGIPDEVTSVLCLGHNPGFSMAATWLTGGHVMLKTAHAALMQTDAPSWSAAFQEGAWTLIALLTPKPVAE